MDVALNNLQRLICHKTQQTKQTNLTVQLLKMLLPNFKFLVNIKNVLKLFLFSTCKKHWIKSSQKSFFY